MHNNDLHNHKALRKHRRQLRKNLVIRFENRGVFEQPDVVLDAIASCFA